jgi:LytS/YehU family sensor histidine kinase
MLRYTVEAGKRQATLLSDEIAFVEDYLGVARERYENPLHFRYRGDPSLLSTSVPPLLLQPLVENSLKHGISADGGSLRMTLDAKYTQGWFELEFADDGVPHGNGTPSLGIGLDNLESRVRHFAGPNARVQATPRGSGGFSVRMAWPVPTGGSE